MLKGILTAEDARLAVEHGVDAIVVSNHGARQLDRVSASVDVLGEVADAVAGRVELWVDGGVRRGLDIVIALALGARGVLARPADFWALAAGGQAGVERALAILRDEFEIALTLLGAPTPADIAPSTWSRRARQTGADPALRGSGAFGTLASMTIALPPVDPGPGRGGRRARRREAAARACVARRARSTGRTAVPRGRTRRRSATPSTTSCSGELVALETAHPALITPGVADPAGRRHADRHVRRGPPRAARCCRLSNAFSHDELRAFDARVRKGLGLPAAPEPAPDLRYVAELKIDGLAITPALRARPVRPGRDPR